MRSRVSAQSQSNVDFFLGFRLLYNHPEIRSLTISRLLSNLAFVTYTTSIPLVIAAMANKDQSFFTYQLAVTNSLISAGFICAGLISAQMFSNNSFIVFYVYCGTILGLISCFFLIAAFISVPFLYISACLLGIGIYCFRISGMVLGQAFTPPNFLGPVIIAGDMTVRTCSFLVAGGAIFVFELYSSLGLSFGTLFFLANLLPLGSILAPKWILPLARSIASNDFRHAENQRVSKK